MNAAASPAERARAAQWLAEAATVTVLTGAGISTDSGIPDFRGPNGVWTRDPAAAQMFSLQNYVADGELRRRAWRNRRDHPIWAAQPNAGHRALVDLERSGRLHALVTQNIDGLHQLAGSSPEKVIEIHGTLTLVECLDCGARTAMADALARVDAGEADPHCLDCGGILKSATVSFGQQMHEPTLRAAYLAAAQCELLLAVGTSLTVHPAAGLVDVAKRFRARVVILNGSPTPYDEIADAVIREPIGTALPALLAAALEPDGAG
jgi:NAD-dependent protein deacetylase/lipoamidase